MLVKLTDRSSRSGGSGAGSEVASLLLGCHERIRRYTLLAARLLEENVGDEERAEAAAAVERYFAVALPLHVADEEQTIAPLVAPHVDAAILDQMASQHGELDRAIVDILPAWTAIAEHPASWREHATVAREGASLLASHFEPHLRLEEEHLFPLLERLSPGQLSTALAEMRARRA